MVGRRAAVLAGVAAFGAGVLAAVALADNSPPPGFQAAVQACAAQGLKQGTDAFAQCVSKQLGGTPPPPGSPVGTKPPNAAPSPTSAAGKAAQQCIAQGLKPGSSDLNGCVQRLLLSPPMQKLYDACVAQGKTPGNGLADCVAAAARAASSPKLTPRQQDDVDYCLGLGKVQGTPEFSACIRTAGNRTLTPGQQAAVDQCQKQGKTGQALADCVGDLLTVKLPPMAGTSGPSPVQVQAAFNACLKQRLKPPSAAFQACVAGELRSP